MFKKDALSATRIIEVPTLAFTDCTVAMQQNAKMTEVPVAIHCANNYSQIKIFL
jgi:hypothetical protein